MPKLTADSLEKKFVCQYCGESVRTRQGLSGHIQWKHGKKSAIKKADIPSFLSKAPDVMLWKTTSYLPQSTLQAIANLIAGWPHVKSFCSVFEVELTKQDFKNYFLAGFAQAFSNHY